ncbi:hypothetical protein [Mycobacteroides abscessus]|uniref:hypothetical protein n=1 Tax=Mycobacteroides abscessus TaxID=36809 RepID=UPI0021075A82|nr:hypothetical protein [Mycobacteroides abscessus]
MNDRTSYLVQLGGTQAKVIKPLFDALPPTGWRVATAEYRKVGSEGSSSKDDWRIEVTIVNQDRGSLLRFAFFEVSPLSLNVSPHARVLGVWVRSVPECHSPRGFGEWDVEKHR